MKTTTATSTQSLLTSAVGAILLTLSQSPAQASSDAQTYPAWSCKPAGGETQISARSIAYTNDGAIRNNNQTRAVSVICPLPVKHSDRKLKHVEIAYTDNHPTAMVRCTLKALTPSSRQVISSISDISRENGSGHMKLAAESPLSGTQFVVCSLPPRSNGRASELHAYTNYREGKPPWKFPTCLPPCRFDGGGVSYQATPAIVANVTGVNHEGLAYYSASTGSVSNLSPTESLTVVFPLVRDKMSNSNVQQFNIRARVRGGLGSATCQLNQTNHSGSFEGGVFFDWDDPDGDGEGRFMSPSTMPAMTSTTVLSAKCVLPPRLANGASILWSLSYTDE